MNGKIFDEIKRYNKKSIFKIKYRKVNNGFSLYLEIRRKGIRQSVNLNNLVISGQVTKLSIDKAILTNAHTIQRFYDEKFNESGNLDFTADVKKKDDDFFAYIESIIAKQKHNTAKSWKNTLSHLKKYTGKQQLKFSDIDKMFCKRFVEYLKKKVSNNSAYTYLSKLKQALYEAVDDEIIDKNPAQRISVKRTTTNREFLTLEELEKVNNTDCHDKHLKNAFIFSCYTGLRFVDISKLTFSNIHQDDLMFTQTKTNEPLKIKLHENALAIISRQKKIIGKHTGLLFDLSSYEVCRRRFNKFIQKVKLDKKITFHCGRHTFATLCITYEIDLYTVKELLGQKDIRHTQIYAKIINKKRDEAIDKLPII